MSLGKRSGVIATKDAPKESKVVGEVIPASGDGDGVIGTDGGATMKKYGQHLGGAAHAGEIQHSGERLQGNVGDNPHYADQPDSA